MLTIKNIIKSFLKFFNIGTIKHSSLENLHAHIKLINERLKITEEKLRIPQGILDDFNLLITLPNEHASNILQYLPMSKSQFRQDLFVLSQLHFKKNGFFVEFGATNGIDLSNTYLMEKEFGWNGILAEPATCWHNALKNNRTVNIECNCVWSDSLSTLIFNETNSAELSTVNNYSAADLHNEARKNGKLYNVKTISLEDLLKKYNAPKEIDYLSIDTEGSEFDILNNFNFNQYSFNVITCEHNYTTPKREQLFTLLTENGYIRKFEELSKFDDWYVKSN